MIYIKTKPLCSNKIIINFLNQITKATVLKLFSILRKKTHIKEYQK